MKEEIYVRRAGFLDGAAGFLLAIVNAETSYYPYMKAWLAMRQRKDAKPRSPAP